MSSVRVRLAGPVGFAAPLRVRGGARETEGPPASESGSAPEVGLFGCGRASGLGRLEVRRGPCGGSTEVNGAALDMVGPAVGRDGLGVRMLPVPGGAFFQHTPVATALLACVGAMYLGGMSTVQFIALARRVRNLTPCRGFVKNLLSCRPYRGVGP